MLALTQSSHIYRQTFAILVTLVISSTSFTLRAIRVLARVSITPMRSSATAAAVLKPPDRSPRYLAQVLDVQPVAADVDTVRHVQLFAEGLELKHVLGEEICHQDLAHAFPPDEPRDCLDGLRLALRVAAA